MALRISRGSGLLPNRVHRRASNLGLQRLIPPVADEDGVEFVTKGFAAKATFEPHRKVLAKLPVLLTFGDIPTLDID